MTEPKWKVGDWIVFVKPSYHHQGKPSVTWHPIVRIARKYFYVGRESGSNEEFAGFEIATGREKPKDPNFTSYLGRAYTPAEYEDKKLRDGYLAKLREFGVRWGDTWDDKVWKARKFSTDRLRELVVLLECVEADHAAVDLDT